MTTIPRLELTAATVAVTVGWMMESELDIPIEHIAYHTDSTTVLHYINNERKRYPVFVSNRVRQIRDFSSPTQWKYVNTKENPADIASRGVDDSTISSLSTWLNGPKFLHEQDIHWPKQPDLSKTYPETFDEQSISTAQATVVEHQVKPVDVLIQHYSSWFRLKKAVAVYLA
jgi:hypothetical protein